MIMQAHRARYVVGIDLGTTNCAVAYASLEERGTAVHQLPILQLVAEGECVERATLPSFLYLGGGPDLPQGALALPWDSDRNYAVGEFARRQGARVPGRLVSSAKSWLCHAGVDRQAPILPWGAAEGVPRLSPVEASARYLQHIRESWDQRFPQAPLTEQEVILTIPASFDEVARELTWEAARRAGLEHLVLLEEPQAALYAWLQGRETTAASLLGQTHLIVVVDVGGGTTDFSLVTIDWPEGRLSLDRVAVGDHILLGGDNMDMALARRVEDRLGETLDTSRFFALVHACRSAKEHLLSDDTAAQETVIVPARGRSVVGGTRTAVLSRDEVVDTVVHGFFPQRGFNDRPREEIAVPLQEWGLPYASDPEIPRHLAAFLATHFLDSARRPRWPDAVLFNGGALKPALLRARLRALLQQWAEREVQVLDNPDLDLAVARGAAYYGLVRHGRGIRIGGGAARTYYLGFQRQGGTVPALCLVERGMQEGEERDLSSAPLELVTNQAVQFPLFASSTRQGDRAGQLVELERHEVQALPSLRTVLRFGRKLTTRLLPVTVRVRLTEVGTLEIWCVSQTTDHRWRLEFDLRDTRLVGAEGSSAAPEESEGSTPALPPERLLQAEQALRATFAPASASSADPVRLVRTLEDALGLSKEDWPLPALRRLWDVLWDQHEHRASSPEHEARWYNLAGYFLRPGFGTAKDRLRVQYLWRLKPSGPQFARVVQVRTEWWNMWKRVAGGLDRAQQTVLWNEVAPYLLPRLKGKARNLPRVGPQEVREYWQLLASCEWLSAEQKAELGEELVRLIKKGRATDAEIWALGRLGSRAPAYGPLNNVVKRDTGERWVEQLLALPWVRAKTFAFAIAQLARAVGDRERDLQIQLRERVAARLLAEGFGERLARMVREPTPLGGTERTQVFAESLPVGLVLREATADA